MSRKLYAFMPRGNRCGHIFRVRRGIMSSLAIAGLVVFLAACGGSASPAGSSPSSGSPSAAGSALAPAGKSQSGASSGASHAQNPYAPKPGEAPVAVKAAWCNASGAFFHLWVAQDAKIFQENGLQVTSSLINGSMPALAALQAGQIDFLYCAAAATIPGIASGTDAVIVGAPLTGMPFTLVAKSSIPSVEALRGKNVAVSQAGDLLDRLGHDMLKYYKMPPDAMNFRPLGGQAQEYEALKSGAVDAAIVSAPLDAQAEQDGYKIIFRFNDLKLAFIYSSLHANSKTIKERPQLVQRFVASMAKAIWYADTHKAEAEQIIGKETKLSDKYALDSAYDAYAKGIVNRSLVVPLPAVQDTIEYSREHGTKVTRAKAEDMVNNHFAEDLAASGYLTALWGAPVSPAGSGAAPQARS